MNAGNPKRRTLDLGLVDDEIYSQFKAELRRRNITIAQWFNAHCLFTIYRGELPAVTLGQNGKEVDILRYERR